MVLVDTSVWISHFRGDGGRLSSLLNQGLVATHPFVIGELACKDLENREQILDLMEALPMATTAEHEEVLDLLASHRLMGQGLGWVDAHLLASARLSSMPVWTGSRRLSATAAGLNVAFE